MDAKLHCGTRLDIVVAVCDLTSISTGIPEVMHARADDMPLTTFSKIITSAQSVGVLSLLQTSRTFSMQKSCIVGVARLAHCSLTGYAPSNSLYCLGWCKTPALNIHDCIMHVGKRGTRPCSHAAACHVTWSQWWCWTWNSTWIPALQLHSYTSSCQRHHGHELHCLNGICVAGWSSLRQQLDWSRAAVAVGARNMPHKSGEACCCPLQTQQSPCKVPNKLRWLFKGQQQ